MQLRVNLNLLLKKLNCIKGKLGLNFILKMQYAKMRETEFLRIKIALYSTAMTQNISGFLIKNLLMLIFLSEKYNTLKNIYLMI